MKFRRILAIVLAVAMAATIIPAAVFAETEPAGKAAEELPEKESVTELESSFNNASTYITYTNGNPGFTGEDNGSYKYIESSNAGQANTTATITAETFTMSVGETLSFWYWYHTETGYDRFIFTDNGTVVFAYSGSSGGSGSTPSWVEYTYTCSTAGEHTFAWKYQKDSGTDTGADCVRLMDLRFMRHEKQYFARAASAQGNSGGFSYASAGNYPFEVRYNISGGSNDLYVRSTNQGVANSDSSFYLYLYAYQDWILSFDYAVSGEQFYDKLIVKVDGTEVASFTELEDFSWHTYGYTFTSTGYHTVYFTYHKDGSTDSGQDVACIDNISLDTSTTNANIRRLYRNTFASPGLDVSEQPLNTPQDVQGYVPVTNSDNSNKRVRNNNRYLSNSTSVFELLITMNMSETVSFDYFVSCEKNYDYFSFCVDGEEQLRQSGWQNESWRSYTFTAPSNGTFVLTWKYVKDNSISRGWDYATISNVTYDGDYEQDLDDVLNVSGGNLHFNNGGLGFVECNKYFHSAATAANKYFEDTQAYVYTDPFRLNEGDIFRFMYSTDTETGSDFLRFYIKLEGASSYDLLQNVSGNSNGWQYFEYTAEYSGSFVFMWNNTKDSGVNVGEDRVYIDNVEIVRYFPDLDEALNPDGMDPSSADYLSFTNDGDYPFQIGEYDGRLFARSTNQGISNSSCSTSTSLMVGASGATLSFDYVISSETNYDKLVFFVDGVQQAAFSGNEEGDETWQTYTCSIGSGMHELTWTYQKDGSVNGGYDTAVIDNVRFTGGSGGLLGDVNGDGFVDITDALLVMRYAMGLITLTPAQLQRANVNGDSGVDISDALIIMRVAMGLITL